jgi:hypothetical protein
MPKPRMEHHRIFLYTGDFIYATTVRTVTRSQLERCFSEETDDAA